MGIWLVLPFLCGIVFRIRIKDWKGFGLSLNIKTGWKGYVIAVFIYPAITSLAGGFLKNIFEEFAWRGYLVPGLLKCNLNDWLIYGSSGLIRGL